MAKDSQLFHVIWTTFNQYPVTDKNGNWQYLNELYASLANRDISFEMSDPLPIEYLAKDLQKGIFILNDDLMRELQTDIETLCRPGHDRLIGGLDVKAVGIGPTKVEMLVLSNIATVTGKINRLRSRSATLLSFAYPQIASGKNTWRKGVWIAEIRNKHDLAIAIIKKVWTQPANDGFEK